jgi:glyoxylase-like metal-dependent hydrolase (beta-lactamase superfamily II)
MADGSLRFRIGEFDCRIISDGFIEMRQGRLDVGCLFIMTGKRKIMIDTGSGDSFQPTTGKLLQNMRNEGVDPAGIDTIIHTHAHIDHIGGNTDKNGQPVFFNARYVIHKLEWTYWMDRLKAPPVEEKGPSMLATARKNLLPLQDRFRTIEDEADILPGISFKLAPGHTPGNTIVTLSSGGMQLVCIGDLIHDPLEFKQPDMYGMIDFSHEQAIHWRNEVLSQAAASQSLVWACHFPFPGVGHIRRQGDLFDWQPVSATDDI